MAKKKNFIQAAIDSLREAFQALPIRRAVEKVDRRSVGKGKKLVNDLGKTFSDQEIAGALQITRQKYTALKKQIKSGKVASSTLNDLLQEAGSNLKDTTARPRDMTGEYISDKPIKGQRKFKIDYEEIGQDYIEKKMKWAVNVRPGGFASKQSALNWYGGVTGGKEYFKIVKGKRGRYFIYDTRTAAERARRGSVSGKTKAQRLIDRDRV